MVIMQVSNDERRSSRWKQLKFYYAAELACQAYSLLAALERQSRKMCKNPLLDTTDWDWAIDPTGLEYLFRDIYMRYGKPLVVTENGLGAYDTLTEDGKIHDQYRIDYLREHIKAMKRAMDYGVEVLAYCPWSALDLLSTSNGVKKRYGFIYVDRTDDDPKECVRMRKDSFYWYKNVIESNGENLD